MHTKDELYILNETFILEYGVFSHDVTAAMFVSQTSPVGVELLSYANAFFCSDKFA